jgi:Kef-type K+ transport system membrane component KefB
MTLFLQLALLLVIILLAAKLAGYIAIRLGQPSVLGELVVGILLGPSLLNLLHLPAFNENAMQETLKLIGEIGVLLLMFLAGLELRVDELRRNVHVSALAGILGAVLSIVLGWGVGRLFGMSQAQAVFLGLILGASSVSISAQTLMELNQLKSRVGLSLLGAAVFDDVLVVLLLSLFFAITSGNGSAQSFILVFVRMVLFFAAAILFGLWLLPLIIRTVRTLPISQGVLTLAIVTLLGYALAAELLGGMAAITGAFVAGLMFARSPEKETLHPRVSALAYGFFVPIFFVDIGLSLDATTIKSSLGLAVVIILAAIAGKLFGSGLGGRLAGLTWRESGQLGVGMVPRAEVSLIAASLGMSSGFVSEPTLSAVIGMVLVCTLITPPMLRFLFQKT